MEATKCKICGEKHWGSVCGSGRAPKIKSVSLEMVKDGKVVAGGTLKKEPAVKTAFDRDAYQKAYMREYMRKKRAKAKSP